jgi:hypothetical protein
VSCVFDQGVVKKAQEFLVSLYLRLAFKLPLAEKQRVWHIFVSSCMQLLNQPQPTLTLDLGGQSPRLTALSMLILFFKRLEANEHLRAPMFEVILNLALYHPLTALVCL